MCCITMYGGVIQCIVMYCITMYCDVLQCIVMYYHNVVLYYNVL